jgi:hypothetical protein
VDNRQRPLGVKPGVARLPEIAPDALVLPLAIEYGFWMERGGEAFIAFGAPMRPAISSICRARSGSRGLRMRSPKPSSGCRTTCPPAIPRASAPCSKAAPASAGSTTAGAGSPQH